LFPNISKCLLKRRRKIDPQTYPESAALAYEILDRLLFRLGFIKIKPKNILILTPIPAFTAQEVYKLYPDAKLVVVDFSQSLIDEGNALCLPNVIFCLPEQMPDDVQFDLLISLLHMSCQESVPDLFTAMQNVLAPDGVLMAATFGVDTLKELAAAFAQVDSKQHVNSFPDLHDIGDTLLASGFVDPVVDMTQLVVHYDAVADLLTDIRTSAAGCYLPDKVNYLYSQDKLQAMQLEYPQMENIYPATFEIIFVHAFKARCANKKLSATQTVIDASSIPIRQQR
jgi:malonyl-CoA O-methyltransferase